MSGCEPDEQLERGAFRCGVFQLTERAGAAWIGATIYEMEAGDKQGPYHYHPTALRGACTSSSIRLPKYVSIVARQRNSSHPRYREVGSAAEMPGAGTHTTIIQRLAQLAQDQTSPVSGIPEIANFLIDPNVNASWDSYATPEGLQGRYANLGALGPDIFYLMLDYGSGIQEFEDTVMTIAGTFRCVGELSGKINNLIDSDLDQLTDNVWGDIQSTFGYLKGILVDGLLDLRRRREQLLVLLPPDAGGGQLSGELVLGRLPALRQDRVLHAEAARQRPRAAPGRPHVGHWAVHVGLCARLRQSLRRRFCRPPFINRIVESPWRNHWQRHHLVENFMDVFVWARYHDEGTDPSTPGDEQNLDAMARQPDDHGTNAPAEYHYARINDLCNMGSTGIDPILDAAISQVCNLIEQGLFKLGGPRCPLFWLPTTRFSGRGPS